MLHSQSRIPPLSGMVRAECQPGRIWNNPGDESLGLWETVLVTLTDVGSPILAVGRIIH